MFKDVGGNKMSECHRQPDLSIHTGKVLRFMLINLTAISTGFWIEKEMKGKQKVRSRRGVKDGE